MPLTEVTGLTSAPVVTEWIWEGWRMGDRGELTRPAAPAPAIGGAACGGSADDCDHTRVVT
jgi:hypothetical protein